MTKRLSIEITESTDEKLNNHIIWGLKSNIFRTLAEQVVDLVEKDPNNAIKIINKDIVLKKR